MKTIEQESEKQSNELRMYTSKSDFEKGFKAGAKFAQQWISIEEENPPIGEDVIFKLRYKNTSRSYFHTIGQNQGDEIVHQFSKEHLAHHNDFIITHWRLIEII